MYDDGQFKIKTPIPLFWIYNTENKQVPFVSVKITIALLCILYNKTRLHPKEYPKLLIMTQEISLQEKYYLVNPFPIYYS